MMAYTAYRCPECDFTTLTLKGYKIHCTKKHFSNPELVSRPLCFIPGSKPSSECRAFPAYLPSDFEMYLSPEEREIFWQHNPERRYNHVYRVPCRRNSQPFSERETSTQIFSDRGLLDGSNGNEKCDSCTNQDALLEPLSGPAVVGSPSSGSSFSMSPDSNLSSDERSGSPNVYDACTQIDGGIPRPSSSSSSAFKAPVHCKSSGGDQRRHVLPSCSMATCRTLMNPCHSPARACHQHSLARPRAQTPCGGVLRGSGPLNHCHGRRHMECPDTCCGSDSGLMSQLPLSCGSEIARSALKNLRDAWPTCFLEGESAQAQEPLLPGNIMAPNFLKRLGSCTILDYSPCNAWSLVLRCSVCRQPVCGLQEMEKHIKAHLPTEEEERSYRDAASRTFGYVLDDFKPRNLSDTTRGPSSEAPAFELQTPYRERSKSF